jgi:hypothetical protein
LVRVYDKHGRRVILGPDPTNELDLYPPSPYLESLNLNSQWHGAAVEKRIENWSRTS